MSKKIILEDRLPEKIRTVGGVDVSYVGNVGVGAVTVVDYDSLELLETQVATCQVKMPYIPTLLSFREIPPAMAAIKKLKIQPDVFLVDAQGLGASLQMRVCQPPWAYLWVNRLLERQKAG